MKKIRSLFGMKKSRKHAQALGMNSETPAKAIKKFWLLGEFGSWNTS